MDGMSRLQGWGVFNGLQGMDEQQSMLAQMGSPSRNGNRQGQSPVMDNSIQDMLRPIGTPPLSGPRSNGDVNRPGSGRIRAKQSLQMGGSPMIPNVMMEPGGGLTNPGPGQFGRGPSPLEGRLGDVVSPPPRMDELADMLGATHLNGPMPPPMLMRPDQQMRPPRSVQTQLFTQPDFVTGPIGTQQQGPVPNWSQMADMPPKGYKTVICKFWENNMCAKGAGCTFAHGQEDLQRFSVGSSTAGLPPSPLKLDRYKTKLCLFHMQGRCCKGPACPYAHGLEELRPAPMSLGGGMGVEDMQAPLDLAEVLCRGGLQTPPRGALRADGEEMGLLGGSPYNNPNSAKSTDDDHIPLLGGGQGYSVGPSGGEDEEGSMLQAIPGGDELDSAQAMAAARYFEAQQQAALSLLQQHARMAAAHHQQQQQQQQKMPQLTPQQHQMLMQGQKRAMAMAMAGGKGGVAMPNEAMAYRPVSLWPHGPAWGGEDI